MTETVSNVFDLACPNPLKLQEISSLAIIEELWRREIRSTLRNCETLTWSSTCNLIHGIVLEKVLPNMPPTIYDFLKKYLIGGEYAIASWLKDHDEVFTTLYVESGWHKILSTFHDFALDYDGSIHYVRTAKRMLLCDRIGIYEKFKIACLYCFENDIKRIWPSVCTKIDLNEVDLTYHPDVTYWTRFLRNEPHIKHIEEIRLHSYVQCGSKNYSRAQYFWNCIPLERQSQTFINTSHLDPIIFARFILPKLKEPQLEEFLAGRGADFITEMLIYNNPENKDLVLPIWMYIRNKIDKRTFSTLIERLLSHEAYDLELDRVLLCCEIWNSAAQSLKQSAFDNVLLEGEWLNTTYSSLSLPENRRFFMTVLSDASFEERSAVWSKYWPSLILGTCAENFFEIMKLCLRNEEEVALFKENTLFKYENIRPYFKMMVSRDYLYSAASSEVNRFLSFCNWDAQKRMELKQRFLHDPDINFPRYIFRGNLSTKEELANEFFNDPV